ncbi:hypothetical protein DFAR_3370006 [Desulfarculales bacterium]
MECVRSAHADLEDYFRKKAARRVALNRTVSLAGRLYEAQGPLIGKQIILLYHDHDHDRVEVLLENRSTACSGRWTSPSIAGSSATTICCAWNSVPPRPPLATPFFCKNQTRRSAIHATRLPRLLCPHQGALRLWPGT